MANDFPAMEDYNEGTPKKEQALRYNSGKRKWSLVDFQSLEPMVEVLEYGAKKYSLTKKLDIVSLFQLCQESQSVITVKLVKELSHEVFVRHATEKQLNSMVHVKDVQNIDQLIKNLYVEHALSTSEYTLLVRKETKSKNTKIATEIGPNSEIKKEPEVLREERILSIMKKEVETTSYEDLTTTELLKSFIKKSVLKDVKFVAAPQDYMLTMIIELEDTEVFCVASATTLLGCLTTILNYLRKELIILKSFNLDGNILKFSGRDNWKKGMPASEVLESMLRHTFSLLNGESQDIESKCDHIGHIQCNAMFLAYILREKPEFNDLTNEDPSE